MDDLPTLCFYRPERLGVRFGKPRLTILNDSWVVNLRPTAHEETCDPRTYPQRLRGIIGNLKDAQYQYNKRKEKQMFNDNELEFLKETCGKDIISVRAKIVEVVDSLARLGKNLADLKVTEAKIDGILQAIADSEESSKVDRNRCGC